MKTSLALGSTLALLLVSGVSSAATHKFHATMVAANEPPAGSVISTATGTADLTFDDASRMMTGTVIFTGIHGANGAPTTTATAAHIHDGVATTVSGAVIVPIASGNNITSPITVSVVIPSANVAALMTDSTYVNVHSAKFGNGEIRGQLVLQAADAGAEAGADSGTSGTSGTSGASGTSGTSGGTSGTSGTSGMSGGTSGAVTTPADGGAAAPAPAGDSGGCSSAPTRTETNGNGLAMMGLAGLGLALVLRARNTRSTRDKKR